MQDTLQSEIEELVIITALDYYLEKNGDTAYQTLIANLGSEQEEPKRQAEAKLDKFISDNAQTIQNVLGIKLAAGTVPNVSTN